MTAFSLAKNAFFVLGVTPRDGIAVIDDAFDAAVASNPDAELELSAHRQTLVTPRLRLNAEARWLFGIAPATAHRIVQAIDEGHEDDVCAFLSAADAFTKANVAAASCSSFKKLRFVDAVLDAHDEVSPTLAANQIGSCRAVAGFPQPATDQLNEALGELRNAHASAAFDVIVADENPAGALTQLMKDGGRTRKSSMLDALVKLYDRWIALDLSARQSAVQSALDDIVAEKTTPDCLRPLFDSWRIKCLPLSRAARERGLDEPRSSRLFQSVRAAVLKLANDKARFADALRVAEELLPVASELPTASATLKTDIADLKRLVTEAEQFQRIKPLVEAISEAKKSLVRFGHDLLRERFTPKSRGLPGQIARAFRDAVRAVASYEDRDGPWLVIRELALDVNNEAQMPDAASVLLAGALEIATPHDAGTAAKISDDTIVLTKNDLWNDLNGQIQANQFRAAKATVTKLLALEVNADRKADLESTLAHLNKRIEKSRNSMVGWGVAAAIVVALVVGRQNGLSTTSDETAPPQPTASSDVVPGPSAGDTTEEEPPVGTDVHLTINQLRYCLFSKQRLDDLHEMVDATNDNQVKQFNSLIEDFNSRCASYTYLPSDMEEIKSELATSQDRLANDAKSILLGWPP